MTDDSSQAAIDVGRLKVSAPEPVYSHLKEYAEKARGTCHHNGYSLTHSVNTP